MRGEPVRRASTGRALRLVPAQPHAHPAAGAPNEVAIVLPGERKSVAVGRHWVVRVAADAGITGMANQVVELLASELLTNAVLHGSASEGIGLRVRWCAESLRVWVSDPERAEPLVLHPAPVDPGGRGMAIVDAMSSRWGVDAHDGEGKSVWFEVDIDQY